MYPMCPVLALLHFSMFSHRFSLLRLRTLMDLASPSEGNEPDQDGSGLHEGPRVCLLGHLETPHMLSMKYKL